MLGFESQTFPLLLISLGHFSVAKPFFSSGGTKLHKLASLAQWSVCALAVPAPRVWMALESFWSRFAYITASRDVVLGSASALFTHHSHQPRYFSLFLFLPFEDANTGFAFFLLLFSFPRGL